MNEGKNSFKYHNICAVYCFLQNIQEHCSQSNKSIEIHNYIIEI